MNLKAISVITMFLSFICGFYGVVGLYATINFGEIFNQQLFFFQALIGIVGVTAFFLGFIGSILTPKKRWAIYSLTTILSWNILVFVHILINIEDSLKMIYLAFHFLMAAVAAFILVHIGYEGKRVYERKCS